MSTSVFRCVFFVPLDEEAPPCWNGSVYLTAAHPAVGEGGRLEGAWCVRRCSHFYLLCAASIGLWGCEVNFLLVKPND